MMDAGGLRFRVGDSSRLMTVLTVALAIIFLLSGGAKLLSLEFEVQAFMRWGYPLWFMYLIGVAEVVGAISLLLRPLSGLAALALTGLMTGAVLTHIVHLEAGMGALAAIILLAVVTVAWHRRHAVFGVVQRSVRAET